MRNTLPTSAPNAPPTPPVSAVPPTIAAAIAVRLSLRPVVEEAPLVYTRKATPPSPANSPEMT